VEIAVLGTGTVGRALAARLSELGHAVTVGTRDPAATLARTEGASDGMAFAAWAAAHPTVRLGTFAEAATGAAVVVNASNGRASLDVLAAAGAEQLAGTVLLDVANPLDFSGGFPPTLLVRDTDSLGEQIQRAFPDARVVKALNTMTASLMVDPGSLPAESTVFVCGDDADAKQLVRALLAELGHTDVLDLGGIDSARGTEMYLPLWLRIMGALGTASFNVRVVR
jgi:8-hydroxy-5-deazaflavin:NADPH oxidoreductase